MREEAPMNAVPLELHLPDGPATPVEGSFLAGRPQYERDGIVLDVDVTIPPDLETAGWFWHGSFLRLRVEPGACGVAIYTGAFGVQGTFENAREMERIRAELDAAPKKKIRAGYHVVTLPDVPIVAVPEPELAYEQMEIAL
jgi:hypothetical protein